MLIRILQEKRGMIESDQGIFRGCAHHVGISTKVPPSTKTSKWLINDVNAPFPNRFARTDFEGLDRYTARILNVYGVAQSNDTKSDRYTVLKCSAKWRIDS
jgi:hypothetical protein